jgi:hypothetical protein
MQNSMPSDGQGRKQIAFASYSKIMSVAAKQKSASQEQAGSLVTFKPEPVSTGPGHVVVNPGTLLLFSEYGDCPS